MDPVAGDGGNTAAVVGTDRRGRKEGHFLLAPPVRAAQVSCPSKSGRRSMRRLFFLHSTKLFPSSPQKTAMIRRAQTLKIVFSQSPDETSRCWRSLFQTARTGRTRSGSSGSATVKTVVKTVSARPSFRKSTPSPQASREYACALSPHLTWVPLYTIGIIIWGNWKLGIGASF